MRRAAQRISAAIRRGGLMVLGGIFGVVALAFFTVAAWIAAEDAFGSLAAALLIAGSYLILSLILFLVARRRHQRVTPRGRDSEQFTKPPPPPITEAFLAGLRAGRKMRHK
jgi:predicted phage tail protein